MVSKCTDAEVTITSPNFVCGSSGALFSLLGNGRVSVSEFDDLEAAMESPVGHAVELDVWKGLPEDVLQIILKRLPPAAYSRFRCVCRDWKRMLSPSPDWTRPGAHYTLATVPGRCGTKIFCHCEEKFFSLPSSTRLSKEMDRALHLRQPNYMLPHPIEWNLADVDGGLLCYQAMVDGELELCVCNPLTNAVRLISPEFVVCEPNVKLKLLVDPESQTFKVALLEDNVESNVVYDSLESFWNVSDGLFCGPCEFFKWRNVVYGYNPLVHRKKEVLFLALDTKSGRWEKVQVELPHEEYPMKVDVVSHQEQVILVQSSSGRRPNFSVWKLRHEGSPDFSMWENLFTGQERQEWAIQRIAETHSLVHACCGAGYICFLFSANQDSRGTKAVKDLLLKYSFATKRFTLMPLVLGGRDVEKIYRWEPNPDIGCGFK